MEEVQRAKITFQSLKVLPISLAVSSEPKGKYSNWKSEVERVLKCHTRNGEHGFRKLMGERSGGW